MSTITPQQRLMQEFRVQGRQNVVINGERGTTEDSMDSHHIHHSVTRDSHHHIVSQSTIKQNEDGSFTKSFESTAHGRHVDSRLQTGGQKDYFERTDDATVDGHHHQRTTHLHDGAHDKVTCEALEDGQLQAYHTTFSVNGQPLETSGGQESSDQDTSTNWDDSGTSWDTPAAGSLARRPHQNLSLHSERPSDFQEQPYESFSMVG